MYGVNFNCRENCRKKKDNDFGKADDVGPSELRKTAFRFTGQ